MNEEDIKILEEKIKKFNESKSNILDLNKNVLLRRLILDAPEVQLIKNLIKSYRELEEDNYVYHQLMQMQNKREYRSKFLKDFKKEFGENTMPDYDEIYKRYDKQKRQLEDSILKSKIKEIILIPMKEEHDKAIKEFMKKDIPQCVIAADVAQELSYFIGKIEELLEEK